MLHVHFILALKSGKKPVQTDILPHTEQGEPSANARQILARQAESVEQFLIRMPYL